MHLVANQDQRLIRESAHRYFSKSSPVSAFRALREQRDPLGYSESTWRELVELGFPGLAIAEDDGGLGLGFFALGGALEEAGRTLCASPLLATSGLGASAIELAGTAEQRQELLPRICSQGLTLSLALDEAPHHAPDAIHTTARRTADGYRINGHKCFVIDGHVADKLIVVARRTDPVDSPSSLALFLVDRETKGLEAEALHMVDHRNLAHLHFHDVQVPASAELPHADASVLEQILDRARACLAAEMMGSIDEVFERTLSYLRERTQFGVRIGSFQALKHRAARLYTEIELTRSSVAGALAAIDGGASDTPALCALAKLRANELSRLAGNEAIQMHGGIGVTDELDIGLFVKRSRTSMQQFGDSRYLRDRFARLSGY